MDTRHEKVNSLTALRSHSSFLSTAFNRYLFAFCIFTKSPSTHNWQDTEYACGSCSRKISKIISKIPDSEIKLTQIMYRLLCVALKTFIKPFEAPKKSEKIKIKAIFFSSSGIRTGMVNRVLSGNTEEKQLFHLLIHNFFILLLLNLLLIKKQSNFSFLLGDSRYFT